MAASGLGWAISGPAHKQLGKTEKASKAAAAPAAAAAKVAHQGRPVAECSPSMRRMAPTTGPNPSAASAGSTASVIAAAATIAGGETLLSPASGRLRACHAPLHAEPSPPPPPLQPPCRLRCRLAADLDEGQAFDRLLSDAAG